MVLNGPRQALCRLTRTQPNAPSFRGDGEHRTWNDGDDSAISSLVETKNACTRRMRKVAKPAKGALLAIAMMRVRKLNEDPGSTATDRPGSSRSILECFVRRSRSFLSFYAFVSSRPRRDHR
jgi:hypothetical protein